MSRYDDFDMFDQMEYLRETVEAAVQNALEQSLELRLPGDVSNAVEHALPEALEDALADYALVPKESAFLKAQPAIKVLSPDRTKLLVCYGGLKVDGRWLNVQTVNGHWENFAEYPTRAEAAQALQRVLDAIKAKQDLVEL